MAHAVRGWILETGADGREIAELDQPAARRDRYVADVVLAGKLVNHAKEHPVAARVDDQPGRLLDGAKWCLWHGDVHHALQRIDELIERIEHDEQIPQSPERRKFAHTQRT